MDNNQIIRSITSLNDKFKKLREELTGGSLDIPAGTIDPKIVAQLKKINDIETNLKNNFNLFNEKIDNSNKEIDGLKNEVKKIPTATTSPSSSNTPVNVDNNLIKQLKSDIDNLKKTKGDQKSLDDIKRSLKITKPAGGDVNDDINNLKKEIQNIKNTSVNKGDLDNLKKTIQQTPAPKSAPAPTPPSDPTNLAEVEDLIKANFKITNEKFEEVNKAVVELNKNLDKFNEIESKVNNFVKQIDELKKAAAPPTPVDLGPIQKQIDELKKAPTSSGTAADPKIATEITSMKNTMSKLMDINAVTKSIKNYVDPQLSKITKQLSDLEKK